jgi:hypothetical protein
MVPLMTTLDDVKRVAAGLPYESQHDRPLAAKACWTSLKKMHSIGQVPIEDYMNLTRDLERFIAHRS